MRIVSLLPSATEIICGLGLRDQLVGVTHECDHPADVLSLPKVTRTRIPHDATSQQIDTLVREQLKTENALYSLDMEVMTSLQPDLIVTQSLCDVCAVAESAVNEAACSLTSQPKVINLEPSSLADVFQCMEQVGHAAGIAPVADEFIRSLQARVETVRSRSQKMTSRPTVMLLEWIDPPFSAGHWSPELVEIAGGREVVGKAGQRSVCLPWESIVAADPDVMVIACCGFDVPRTVKDLPILKSFPQWDSLTCVRTGRVFVVDGSAYFSRPGPRLVDSLEILANLLAPQIHPLSSELPKAMPIDQT